MSFRMQSGASLQSTAMYAMLTEHDYEKAIRYFEDAKDSYSVFPTDEDLKHIKECDSYIQYCRSKLIKS